MSGALVPVWRIQILSDGQPAAGAKLYTYLSGTSTPKPVYADSTLATARTNPVVADSEGLFPVMYMAPVAYRMMVTDANGATIYPAQDHIYDFGQLQFAWLINVKDFGAVGDGTTNDGPAIQRAFDYAAQNSGGTVFFPPGTYFTSQQLTFGVINDSVTMAISGYGATITTSGSISALKIVGGNTTGRRDVFGLKVDHSNNATATYGIEILEAWHARLQDCTIVANGGGVATYGAIRVANSTEADSSTGSYWTRIENCTIRKESSLFAGNMAIGIILEGAANATNVVGNFINNATVGIAIRTQGAATYMPNGVVIDANDFENCTTAILQSSTAGPAAHPGPRIVNNRAESVTTFFSITISVQADPPVTLANTNLISGAYLNNPNSLLINYDEAGKRVVTSGMNIGTGGVPSSTGLYLNGTRRIDTSGNAVLNQITMGGVLSKQGSAAGRLLFGPVSSGDPGEIQLSPLGAPATTKCRWVFYTSDWFADPVNYSALALDVTTTGVTLRDSSTSGSQGTNLRFNGVTASFPMLKRSAATLQCRLADDSNYAGFVAASYAVGASAGATGSFTTVDGKTVTVTGGIITSIV